jgi:mycoredoxin
MKLPIVVYGATDCDDTERTRHYLQHANIPFREVNIDQDADAERFVVFVNSGFRSTPTVVLDVGKTKILITEPTNEELQALLERAGTCFAG